MLVGPQKSIFVHDKTFVDCYYHHSVSYRENMKYKNSHEIDKCEKNIKRPTIAFHVFYLEFGQIYSV